MNLNKQDLDRFLTQEPFEEPEEEPVAAKPTAEHWYRAYTQLYYDTDSPYNGKPGGPRGTVYLHWEVYPVLRSTEKSVTLDLGWQPQGKRDTRVVLRNSFKKFAHPTREAALESLKMRLGRQKRILQNQVYDNQARLDAVLSGTYVEVELKS